MTFVYPAVFTPHEKDNGFHVDSRIWNVVRQTDRT